MPLLLPNLLLLATCLAPQHPMQQTDNRHLEAGRIEDALFARRVTLCETALERGLLREGARLARAIAERAPTHRVVTRADELRRLTADEFLATYEQGLARHGRSYRKAARRLLTPIVRRLNELGDAALQAGDADFAERMFGRAFAVDPDDRHSLQALKKLDYDVIFNYGALPKADKAAARAMLRALGGRFLERRDLQDELGRGNWNDAWGLQTRHYRFVTNASHDIVFAFARACEDMHAAWDALMRENHQPLRDLSRPMTVQLFDSPLAYETVLRLAGEQPKDSGSVLGYYAPTTRTCSFYCAEERDGGGLMRLLETFYHEGAHQLFDLRLKAPWRGRARDHELHWVEEGMCCYLETLQIGQPDGRLGGTFGNVVDDDLGLGAHAACADSLLPAASFAHQAASDWRAYGLGYQHAALLIHWLVHGERGRLRPLAFELLLAERQRGGLTRTTLFDLLDRTPAELDRALMAHAGRLRTQLAWRQYPEVR